LLATPLGTVPLATVTPRAHHHRSPATVTQKPPTIRSNRLAHATVGLDAKPREPSYLRRSELASGPWRQGRTYRAKSPSSPVALFPPSPDSLDSVPVPSSLAQAAAHEPDASRDRARPMISPLSGASPELRRPDRGLPPKSRASQQPPTMSRC